MKRKVIGLVIGLIVLMGVGKVSMDDSGRLLIKEKNPVVNEGGQIKLSIGEEEGVRWESGSPEIAAVDGKGEVRGIKEGFATVTAYRGGESTSVFVVVTKVRSGQVKGVPGDSKADSSGQLYVSNPVQNVILKASGALEEGEVYAGSKGVSGLKDGARGEALFSGPTAIGVDSREGIYVADTLNHRIRKVGKEVVTIMGGVIAGETEFGIDGWAKIEEVKMRSPRGIAVENGGNLYVADTDNQAIYYVDLGSNRVKLLAGKVGERGKTDGEGVEARFSRPWGLGLSGDGKVLAVADADNNRVRLMELKRDSKGEISCVVTTVGARSSRRGGNIEAELRMDSKEDEEVFEGPRSVSFDGAGNINVVDEIGAKVITRPYGERPEVIELAQLGSFSKAASVTVRGRESIVVDEEAGIKVVTVGEPEISEVSPDTVRMEGGAEVVIRGKNFAPESIVTFGDEEIKDAEIISATEIRIKVPGQEMPGVRTLSVLTRGGVGQKELYIVAKPVEELKVGEITTIAGGVNYTGDGGLAVNAALMGADKMVVDAAGNLYIADSKAGRVRRVDGQTQVITTIAGGGSSTEDGVIATVAAIMPTSIAIDKGGNVYIADAQTMSIRR